MKRLAIPTLTLVFVFSLSCAVAFAQTDRKPTKGTDVRVDRETRVPTPKPIAPGDNRVVHDRETKAPPQTHIVDFKDNPQLRERLAAMLPKGMDLDEAAKGFKNQGQFIAALHASRNSNIPFAALKDRLTRPDHHETLGEAIHDLDPKIDLKDAKKKAEQAEQQAKAMQQSAKPVS